MKIEGEVIVNTNQNDRGMYERVRAAALSQAIAPLGGQGWELAGESRYAKTVSVQLADNRYNTKDDTARYF